MYYFSVPNFHLLKCFKCNERFIFQEHPTPPFILCQMHFFSLCSLRISIYIYTNLISKMSGSFSRNTPNPPFIWCQMHFLQTVLSVKTITYFTYFTYFTFVMPFVEWERYPLNTGPSPGVARTLIKIKRTIMSLSKKRLTCRESDSDTSGNVKRLLARARSFTEVK